MQDQAKERPEIRNIGLGDILSYRMPIAAWVSILHRITGVIMFILLPFVIWMFDASLRSKETYAVFTNFIDNGCAFVPGWFVKLVCLGLIWALMHHLCAGLRHVMADVHHNVSKEQGKSTAIISRIVSLLLTAGLGAKLFGLY